MGHQRSERLGQDNEGRAEGTTADLTGGCTDGLKSSTTEAGESGTGMDGDKIGVIGMEVTGYRGI